MLKTVSSGLNVVGALNYKGTWNASTNSPALASGVGTKGDYYVVSVAGSTNLDGITDWQVGDWAVFNGSIWQKVDNTDAVTSVNGQTGTVVLTASNVGAVANTVNVIAGSGLSGGGALTANVTLTNAGVRAFNTRTGNVTLSSSDVTTALGYTPGTGNGTVTSVTGTAPIASSGGTTPAISIPAANATTNGYLTSTDWSTFNSKGTGNGSVTNVATGTGLTGGPITTTGTISLANTAVTAGTYGNATSVSQITVDAQGRITSASNVAISVAGGVTNVATGTGLTGGPITSTGTISLANTAVTTGSYGGANVVATFTVDQQGRLTAAGNTTIALQNSNLANSTITLGNATLTLGSTTTSVGNLTLTNATANGAALAITTKTGAYTATGTDVTILGNASTGAFSVTLPSAATTSGKVFYIKKIDSSANAVTVATTSSQTIDGGLTEPLSRQYDAVGVQSDGSNWFIVSFVPGRNGTGGSF